MAIVGSHVDPSQQLARLREAVCTDGGDLAAARRLATEHVALNEFVAARGVLSQYVSNNPMVEQGWILAGLLEWKLGRWEDAVGWVRRGLAMMPQSEALWRQHAVFLAARGESAAVPEGTSDLQRPDCLDRVARETRLLAGLLNLPGDEGDAPMWRGIESRLAKLLEAQPLHADRQLLLARVRLRLGDAAGAMVGVQRALRANPDYPQAQRLRAVLLAKGGEYEEAIGIVQGLIARGLDWPDLHVQVAQWQHAAGADDAARQHLYTALRINPRYGKAQAMLERCAA
jgi:tetratricopeptide (TPR) repeat protein